MKSDRIHHQILTCMLGGMVTLLKLLSHIFSPDTAFHEKYPYKSAFLKLFSLMNIGSFTMR